MLSCLVSVHADRFLKLPANADDGVQRRRRVLKNDREPSATDAAHAAIRQANQVHSIENRTPLDFGGGAGKAKDALEESGFPGPAFTDDAKDLAWLHAKVDATHGRCATGRRIEGHMQVFDGQKRQAGSPRITGSRTVRTAGRWMSPACGLGMGCLSRCHQLSAIFRRPARKSMKGVSVGVQSTSLCLP